MTDPVPPAAGEPGEESAIRLLRRIAVPAFGPTMLAAAGQAAALPVLPLMARELGASAQTASLVVAAMGIGQVVAALPAGALVARVGERRALIGSALLEAVAMVVALVAGSVAVLTLAAVLFGMTFAVFTIARQAFLMDLVPVSMRARAMSTLGGMLRIGFVAGPFAAAAATSVWGTGAAFAVGAAGALGAALLVLVTPDLTAGHSESVPGTATVSLRSVISANRLVLSTVGLGVLALAAARAVRMTLLPLWADSIGLDAATLSLIVGVSMVLEVLLFYPSGSVMDRHGRVWIVVPCLLLLGAGFALLPLTHSVLALTGVAVLMGIGNGLGSGIVMTLGSDAAPSAGRAQFLGAFRLGADLGTSLGPLLVSAVTAAASLAAACLAMAGVCAAGAAWLGRWVPRFDPRRRA
ncbi:MAG: MFS transporter [Micrococcales bacterium]|nr:MFS transporter [Micrococcales bacterium]